jgi:quinol monooxygenase YgiN
MLVSQAGNLVTLINVFETKPEQQQALIDHWIRFAEEVVKEEPGLFGTALHTSTDGTRVVAYTQWRSEADWDSFQKKYSLQFASFGPLASRIDPHLYEVVYLYDQAGR